METQEVTKRPRIWLSARAENLVAPNRRIKDRIAEACGVSAWTVHQWIVKRNGRITQADAMNVIKKETGLTEDDLLSEVTEEGKA